MLSSPMLHDADFVICVVFRRLTLSERANVQMTETALITEDSC